MTFYHRAGSAPRALGILAGTFNPPTHAHLALASAAFREVDEVVFVLPRAFPHKPYVGASFEQRIDMLRRSLAGEPRYSIASTEQGLFIDIARAARAAYGPETALHFLCGRDAAERIVNWDYGAPDALAAQLREYGLLVAPRRGRYEPPPEFRDRIRPLATPCDYDEVSATDVRERIRRGEPWEHLVPPPITDLVRAIYRV